MSVTLTVPGSDQKEMAAKRRLVEIEHVKNSEIPYRVSKKSNGSKLGYCKTQEEVDQLLTNTSLDKLRARPTRRVHR